MARLLENTFSEVLGYTGTFKSNAAAPTPHCNVSVVSRWLLRKEITWYLEDCLKLANTGVVLVAMLEPIDNGEQDPCTNSRLYLQPMFRSFPAELDEEETSTTVPASENMRPAPAKTISTVFSGFRTQIDEDKERSVQREAEPAPIKAFEEASSSQVGLRLMLVPLICACQEENDVLSEEASPLVEEEDVCDPAPSRCLLFWLSFRY